ncbi:hypothetical protein HDU99_002008 [Rhizoclosmatium hyalinum]|nr:hypothetical protein HDU99_002008 [Rhizoclosmatium hyalinum]
MNAVFRVTKESDDGSDVQIEDSKEVVLQMLDLDASDEFWGSCTLLQSIIADPPTTPSIADIQQDTLKTLFATTSATIVRRSVDSLYTILYALFPHSTLNQLRTSFSPNVELSWLQEVENPTRLNSPRSQPKYAPSVNPFHAPMIRLLELEVLDESFLVRQRVTFLIRAHRMHPILVFGGGREEEVRGIKESGGRGCNEVLVECLLLRAASDGEGIRSGNTTDKLDVNTVLSVNRALRKSALEQTAPTRALTKSHTSPHILSPHPYHHTTLLLTDLHYDLCLRSALLHQITLLKREKPIHILSTTDRENVFQKLRSQQQEISHLTAALEQVRAESAVMRERHRKYEEDLNRRVRSAREAAKEAKEELESFVKTREGEVEELKKELEESHRRIHHLEQEIHLAEPDLERLAASEAAIKTLNNKFVQHEMDSSTRQALLKQIEEMESQLLAHEILLVEAEKREKGLKERVEGLEAAAAGTSLIEISELEALKIQHKKALDDMRSSNLDRIKVVEEKYQTVNEINLALEMRVMELEAGRG